MFKWPSLDAGGRATLRNRRRGPVRRPPFSLYLAAKEIPIDYARSACRDVRRMYGDLL